MAAQYLSLSLFIMLLSFFIILNGYSSFDKSKASAVVDSLSAVFSEEGEVDPLFSSLSESFVDSIGQGGTLERLEALFSSTISDARIEKNRLGTVMHINLDAEVFEGVLIRSVSDLPEDSLLLEDGGFDFLPTLLSLLDTQNGTPYRMDMILALPDRAAKIQNENPQKMRSILKKISSYANILERSGLPPKLLSSGVGRGKAGTIDLYFYRYAFFNPLGEGGTIKDGAIE